MATHYVSVDGTATWANSTNIATPCSIYTADHSTQAGDRVEIRGGTYTLTGPVSWGYDYDGTAENHVTITAYTGETVIIDGNAMTVPSHNSGNGLVQIYGNYYDLSNIEIKDSGEAGLILIGDYATATNVTVHGCYASGMFGNGDNQVFDTCTAYLNSMKNENGALPISWGFGISLCRYPNGGTIKDCTSYNNWGEGISTFEGYNNTIQDCVAYDNFTVNIYVSDSQGAVCQRNLSYFTAGNQAQEYASSQNCIALGDEGHTPASNSNTIINNICWGGDRCLYSGGLNMTSTLVAGNTFVEAFDRLGTSEAACVYFGSGSPTGGRFADNIIDQVDLSGVLIAHLEASGITFDHNCWSSAPVAGCRGTGDRYADPTLAKTGATTAGDLAYGYFLPKEGSPAINNGQAIEAVTVDYNGAERADPPDMGALVYTPPGGGVGPFSYRLGLTVSSAETARLLVDQPVKRVVAGQPAVWQVWPAAWNDFAASVTLGLTGLPAGAAGQYGANPVAYDGATTVTVTTDGVAAGSYPMWITGTATGGDVASVKILLEVVDTADFALKIPVRKVRALAGDNAVFTVEADAISGFTSDIDLSVSGLPTGATGTFGDASLAYNASTTLTIGTTGVNPGTYEITVTGEEAA